MQLYDLIRIYESGFDPKLCKVHLARWNGEDDPMDVFRAGHFESWQNDQNALNFKLPFLLSLVQTSRGSTRYAYAGYFRVLGVQSKRSGKTLHRYEMERVKSMDELLHRLFVKTNYSQRQSYPNATTLDGRIEIEEITAKPHLMRVFPGYTQASLSMQELDLVVRHEVWDWKAALSSVKGIYVITDEKTGRLYIGKADGQSGIWGRWCQYAKTAHGGNKLLIKELGQSPADRRFDLRCTVLEILDKRATKDEINSRESYWKEVLASVQHGYNMG